MFDNDNYIIYNASETTIKLLRKEKTDNEIECYKNFSNFS